MLAKRRSQRSKIQLTIGQDPALWRYGSLDEVLAASRHILAEMLQTEIIKTIAENEKEIDEKAPSKES